jgi:Flp pilus assembly protein TadD
MPRSPQRAPPAFAPPREEAARRAREDAARWLGSHWLTLAAVAFVVVRVLLRVRAGREAHATEAAAAGGGWLGPPRRALTPARGDDPLARAAALRAEAARRPGDVALRLDLGKAWLESGRPHEAVGVLAEAAKDGPGDARIHLELGRALGQLCRWDDALVSLAEAVRLAPEQPEAHELRGEVLAEKHWSGQDALAPEARTAFREAIRLYGQSLAADPLDATARARMGSLQVGLGELEVGLVELQRAAAQRPADPEVRAALAEALAGADRRDEAARQYALAAEAQRALALANPNHAGHHDRLGDLLNEAGADGDGEAWYEASLIDPDYPDLEIKLMEQGGEIEGQFFKGARHLKAGEWTAAGEAFREVVAEKPVHAAALYGLGVALWRQHRRGQAEQVLARALELWPGWRRCGEALQAVRHGHE